MADRSMKPSGKNKSDWNNGPPAKRKSGKAEVSRDQLLRAIQTFQHQGGLIRTLPPQNANRRYSVGGNLESGFENVIDS